MKKEAILHIPLSQFAYQEKENKLIIRLRAAKNDLDSCILFYGDRVDPVEPIRTKQLEMKKAATDDLFDYFETEMKDHYTRVCYYFKVSDGKETWFYCERNFCEEMTCSRTEYFQFPYLRREDQIAVPEWAKNVVMYHIFPDSFASVKRGIKQEAQMQEIKEKGVTSKEEKICCTRSNLGGTLKGVEENLDYLEELGVNCIYLNPIFAANSYHKYDTIDYFQVDPCLGNKNDLKNLVRACHRRGIRVLLDGVFNHCGPDFFAFGDVLEKGKKSPYYDWFYDMPEPIRYEDPPSYEAFAYVKEMPKLNTGNPEVENYFIEVGTYWITEADIDGWRLDVANEINHDFWRHFRKAVRSVKQDAFLIGEIWEDAGVWLQGDQFDSTMNYRFSYLCRDFFGQRKLTVSEFDAQIQKMIYRYPAIVSLAQMNFLDSHDIPRFLSSCQGERKRMELAFFYLFMGYGIPSVFYGDEYYVEGVTEPEYRSAMPWGKEENAISFFQKWISFRREHSAIQNGSYRSVYCKDENGIYAFLRENKEERILVILNNSDKDYQIEQEFLEKVRKLQGKESSLKLPEILPALTGDVFLL
ncbi:MAG: glycoside hydrolase family 13 protein [Roseburia sp.]